MSPARGRAGDHRSGRAGRRALRAGPGGRDRGRRRRASRRAPAAPVRADRAVRTPAPPDDRVRRLSRDRRARRRPRPPRRGSVRRASTPRRRTRPARCCCAWSRSARTPRMYAGACRARTSPHSAGRRSRPCSNGSAPTACSASTTTRSPAGRPSRSPTKRSSPNGTGSATGSTRAATTSVSSANWRRRPMSGTRRIGTTTTCCGEHASIGWPGGRRRRISHSIPSSVPSSRRASCAGMRNTPRKSADASRRTGSELALAPKSRMLVASGVVLALTTALAVYAITQRSEAQRLADELADTGEARRLARGGNAHRRGRAGHRDAARPAVAGCQRPSRHPRRRRGRGGAALVAPGGARAVRPRRRARRGPGRAEWADRDRPPADPRSGGTGVRAPGVASLHRGRVRPVRDHPMPGRRGVGVAGDPGRAHAAGAPGTGRAATRRHAHHAHRSNGPRRGAGRPRRLPRADRYRGHVRNAEPGRRHRGDVGTRRASGSHGVRPRCGGPRQCRGRRPDRSCDVPRHRSWLATTSATTPSTL